MDAVARDAGLARRLAALALDVALLAVGAAVIGLVVWKSGLAGMAQHSPGDGPAPGPSVASGAVWAAAAAVCVAVAAAWRLLGATPGALLLGARLVSRRGDRPGWARCVLRLGLALALGGAGLLWSLGGRRALHDRLSGTRLVLEDEALERPAWRALCGAPGP